ncbi:unnamed protein product [Cercopithifilaria johnstoni]|uniref:Uncharacterized protein n=1 Tax=Cercopithifilaria johnstoni TaxID=2874296 RepID=A0A8J2MAS2_9BILA|nr:unnamed protein product [Cercopithifilaria johnstoni]
MLVKTELIDSSGFVTFTLNDFHFDKAQGYGICCSADHAEKECHCQMYIHICVGVGFEHRKYHRDCSLLHHNSRVIDNTRPLSNYNVSIPFDVRWPVKFRYHWHHLLAISSDYLQLPTPHRCFEHLKKATSFFTLFQKNEKFYNVHISNVGI